VTAEDAAVRLLVVSHEEEVRVLLRRSLRSVGYEVEVAAGEAEALGRIDDGGGARLVLVDLSMPRRGGWAVFTRLRALPARPPVVVLVPRGDYRSFAEAVRDGAAACVLRPFETDDLIATCQAVLTPAAPPTGQEERRLDVRCRLVADLGLGGAQVRLPTLVEAGTRLRIVLPVRVGSPLTFDAVVQWTGRARGGYAHGLAFLELTLALRRQLDDLVSANVA
jgi:CheY-like chemotaxis protein